MCKCVHFSSVESTTIATVNSISNLSQFERSSIWYKRSEIESFRTDAKKICRSAIHKRKLSSISGSEKVPEIMEITEGNQVGIEVSIRGFEFTINPERKKRRRYANKIIVIAQKSMKDTELAEMSSSLSCWTRENAIEDARSDFLAACPHILR